MAIYAPGIRDKHNRPKRSGKRSVVAMLSLTAMVDMFTVLAVFLLQNYQTTGEVIELSDEVTLPRASSVKELKPAHVVLVSPTDIMLDKVKVADVPSVKAQADWMVPKLQFALAESFRMAEERKRQGLAKLRQAVEQNKSAAEKEPQENDRRITIQADKSVDFLTIKKVMYTLYESGASEINFAVLKDEKGTVTR